MTLVYKFKAFLWTVLLLKGNFIFKPIAFVSLSNSYLLWVRHRLPKFPGNKFLIGNEITHAICAPWWRADIEEDWIFPFDELIHLKDFLIKVNHSNIQNRFEFWKKLSKRKARFRSCIVRWWALAPKCFNSLNSSSVDGPIWSDSKKWFPLRWLNGFFFEGSEGCPWFLFLVQKIQTTRF